MGLNFDVSLSGILAGQKGLKVTQNNIANINTESYARQQVDLHANNMRAGAGVEGQIGNGVWVEEITRIKDEFLIAQSRNEKSLMSYYGAMQDELSTIEGIFNETSSGSVSNMLTKFFNSWDELSKFPEEASYRNALVSVANSFSTKLNDINNDLNETRIKLDEDIVIQVKKINELVAKIAAVNDKLTKVPTDSPNSMFDERDRYLDELAQYIDVEVSNDIKNPLLVNVKVGGVSVISGTEHTQLTALLDRGADEWVIASGNMPVNVQSGSLAGDLQMRNGSVAGYQNELNEFVSLFITEVNAIHQTGYGLDDTTGVNFFLGTGIHNIQVNPLFKSNPEKIATSSDVSTPGNADISKLVAELKHKNFLAGGTANPIGFYNGFAIKLATELNIASDNQHIHETMYTNVQSNRQSVQGVNMDEELANLMQFQQYYTANSKVITAIDKLYDALLQMV